MANEVVSSAENPEVLPAPINESELDILVQNLNALARNTTLQFALDVGRSILDACYGGDLEAWRARGDKDSSYRALRKREDLELDKVLVSRAVRLYDLEQRLGVSALKRLTATHFYAVLGLPEKQQKRLLAKADEKGWTTRQLEDEAKKARKSESESERRGRPPLPSFQKSVRRISRVVEKREEFFGDLDQLEAMSTDELNDLFSQVAGIKIACEELQEHLRHQMTEGRSVGEE